MQAVLRGSQERTLFFFDFPSVSPGDQPLAKELKDSGYEIGTIPNPTRNPDSEVSLCPNKQQYESKSPLVSVQHLFSARIPFSCALCDTLYSNLALISGIAGVL